MLTRCPACGTTFRLHPAQLAKAQGRVRCGKCNAAFSAVEHRIDNELDDEVFSSPPPEETSARPPLPGSAVQFSAPGQRKRFLARPEVAPDEVVTPDSTDDEPRFDGSADITLPPETDEERLFEAPPEADTPSIVESIAEAPSETIDEAPAGAPPTIDIPSIDESMPEAPTEPVVDVTDEPLAETASETVFGNQAEPSSEPPAEPSIEAATTATGDDVEVPGAPTIEPTVVGEEAGTAPGANGASAIASVRSLAEEDETGDESESTPAEATPFATADYLADAAPTRRWPWLAGAAFLVATLLVQILYAYRTDIAKKHPDWRPSLESTCKRFGCTIDLPRDAELVSIVSSELNPESEKSRLRLEAHFKNRANYPQSYPNLELTLTDVRDQALLRRVFTPAEYLASNAAPAFAPDSEVAVKLVLEVAEVSASGYRVYVFYP